MEDRGWRSAKGEPRSEPENVRAYCIRPPPNLEEPEDRT
jgi:hypothetical protein